LRSRSAKQIAAAGDARAFEKKGGSKLEKGGSKLEKARRRPRVTETAKRGRSTLPSQVGTHDTLTTQASTRSHVRHRTQNHRPSARKLPQKAKTEKQKAKKSKKGEQKMSASSGDDGPDDRVCLAVAAGATQAEVRRAIIESAAGSFERRAVAVNRAAGPGGETPLSAAHRLRRGDLVGLLLEAGADAMTISPRETPLVLCIAYNQVASLRALLVHRLEDANEQVAYGPGCWLDGAEYGYCAPVHLCIRPRQLSQDAPRTQIHLEALEILLREVGADVNAMDVDGRSPLHYLLVFVGVARTTLDLLLRSGARVDPLSILARSRRCTGARADPLNSGSQSPVYWGARRPSQFWLAVAGVLGRASTLSILARSRRCTGRSFRATCHFSSD